VFLPSSSYVSHAIDQGTGCRTLNSANPKSVTITTSPVLVSEGTSKGAGTRGRPTYYEPTTSEHPVSRLPIRLRRTSSRHLREEFAASSQVQRKPRVRGGHGLVGGVHRVGDTKGLGRVKGNPEGESTNNQRDTPLPLSQSDTPLTPYKTQNTN